MAHSTYCIPKNWARIIIWWTQLFPKMRVHFETKPPHFRLFFVPPNSSSTNASSNWSHLQMLRGEDQNMFQISPPKFVFSFSQITCSSGPDLLPSNFPQCFAHQWITHQEGNFWLITSWKYFARDQNMPQTNIFKILGYFELKKYYFSALCRMFFTLFGYLGFWRLFFYIWIDEEERWGGGSEPPSPHTARKNPWPPTKGSTF